MSTLNGMGTTRYDWESNGDGTANSTVWFVVFFLPVFPLRRERVRVLPTEKKRDGALNILAVIAGYGSGFETQIQILDSIPNSIGRILKTYLLAYIGVPVLAIFLPILLMVGLIAGVEASGFDIHQHMSKIIAALGLGISLWIVVVVASILDRSAGRKHVCPTTNDETREIDDRKMAA